MHTESDIGIFGIIPREIHEIIVSQSPHHFWCLNKYFRTLACRSLNTSAKYLMLRCATRNGTIDLVDYILQSTCIPFKKIQSALQRAGNTDVEIVDKLLQYKSDEYTGPIEISVLKTPILENRVDILERLLQDCRIDPNSKPSVFTYVSILKSPDALDFLLQHKRIDPAANDNYAIQEASMCGNLSMVEKLLQDTRVDPTSRSNLAVKKAVEHCHYDVIEMLLQDPRIRKHNGIITATLHSITFDQLTVTRMLFEKGYINPTLDDNVVIFRLFQVCNYRPDSRIHRHSAKYATVLLYEIIQDKRVNQEKPLINAIKDFMNKDSTKSLLQDCETETKRRKTDQ